MPILIKLAQENKTIKLIPKVEGIIFTEEQKNYQSSPQNVTKNGIPKKPKISQEFRNIKLTNEEINQFLLVKTARVFFLTIFYK